MNRREPATMLKSFPLLALVTLFSLSSCDKVRKLASQLEKKPRAAAVAPLSGSGVSEIPKGIAELLPSNPSRILMVDYYAEVRPVSDAIPHSGENRRRKPRLGADL